MAGTLYMLYERSNKALKVTESNLLSRNIFILLSHMYDPMLVDTILEIRGTVERIGLG